MKNYRPYKDVKPINFAYNDSNLTIIEGDNDLGKTTILNAISWCLYDDEPFRNYSTRVFNADAGSELKKGEKLQVIVEILMEDNEGNDVVFNRTREYRKDSSGSITKVPNLDELEIHTSSSSNDEVVTNTDKYLETHLPYTLKEYFLFDGERLLEWFSGDMEEVKDAINRLYQADLIENVKKRILTQRDNFNEDLREYNEELADLNQQKNKLIEDFNKEKEKYEENESLIEEYTKQKKEAEKIKEGTDGNPNELLEKINELEDEIKDKKEELDEVKNNHMSFLFKNFPIVIGYPSLKEILSIKNEEGSQRVKYNFKDTQQVLKLIETLFNQKKCICGSDLIEGTSAFSNMANFKEIVTDMENSNNVDELQEKIVEFLYKYPNSLNDAIDNYWKKEDESLKYINKRTEKVSDYQEKYNRIIEEINLDEIEEKIKTCETLITNLTAKNIILDENIKEYPRKIENIQKQIDLVKSTNEDEEKIKEKLQFCENIAKQADFLKQELGLRLHEEIQKSVNTEFESIYNGDGIRKKYKNIIIDESFDISIEKCDGEIVTSVDPSSGAQLAIALSFITAINSSSGYKLPQIMDTSLGRWGKRLRNNFSKILPDYLEKNQMVFLFLDSEYDGPFKEKISDYVGKEYELDYGSENTTIIIERNKEN